MSLLISITTWKILTNKPSHSDYCTWRISVLFRNCIRMVKLTCLTQKKILTLDLFKYDCQVFLLSGNSISYRGSSWASNENITETQMTGGEGQSLRKEENKEFVRQDEGEIEWKNSAKCFGTECVREKEWRHNNRGMYCTSLSLSELMLMQLMKPHCQCPTEITQKCKDLRSELHNRDK